MVVKQSQGVPARMSRGRIDKPFLALRSVEFACFLKGLIQMVRVDNQSRVERCAGSYHCVPPTIISIYVNEIGNCMGFKDHQMFGGLSVTVPRRKNASTF